MKRLSLILVTVLSATNLFAEVNLRTTSYVVAAGPGGGPHVKVRELSGAIRCEFFAFDASMTKGLRVASGTVTVANRTDIVVAKGPGGDGKIRVFNGTNCAFIREIDVYGAFTGGVFVAVGDVDGDGIQDIITGAGPGGGPHVKVIDARTGGTKSEFYAYAANITAGVAVAAGDLGLAGGKASIITAPSARGFGSHIRVFSNMGTIQAEFMAPIPRVFEDVPKGADNRGLRVAYEPGPDGKGYIAVSGTKTYIYWSDRTINSAVPMVAGPSLLLKQSSFISVPSISVFKLRGGQAELIKRWEPEAKQISPSFCTMANYGLNMSNLASPAVISACQQLRAENALIRTSGPFTPMSGWRFNDNVYTCDPLTGYFPPDPFQNTQPVSLFTNAIVNNCTTTYPYGYQIANSYQTLYNATSGLCKTVNGMPTCATLNFPRLFGTGTNGDSNAMDDSKPFVNYSVAIAGIGNNVMGSSHGLLVGSPTIDTNYPTGGYFPSQVLPYSTVPFKPGAVRVQNLDSQISVDYPFGNFMGGVELSADLIP